MGIYLGYGFSQIFNFPKVIVYDQLIYVQILLELNNKESNIYLIRILKLIEYHDK